MLERYTQRELTAISVIYIYSVPNRLRSQNISFQFVLCIERYLANGENWDLVFSIYQRLCGAVERKVCGAAESGWCTLGESRRLITGVRDGEGVLSAWMVICRASASSSRVLRVRPLQ